MSRVNTRAIAKQRAQKKREDLLSFHARQKKCGIWYISTRNFPKGQFFRILVALLTLVTKGSYVVDMETILNTTKDIGFGTSGTRFQQQFEKEMKIMRKEGLVSWKPQNELSEIVVTIGHRFQRLAKSIIEFISDHTNEIRTDEHPRLSFTTLQHRVAASLFSQILGKPPSPTNADLLDLTNTILERVNQYEEQKPLDTTRLEEDDSMEIDPDPIPGPSGLPRTPTPVARHYSALPTPPPTNQPRRRLQISYSLPPVPSPQKVNIPELREELNKVKAELMEAKASKAQEVDRVGEELEKTKIDLIAAQDETRKHIRFIARAKLIIITLYRQVAGVAKAKEEVERKVAAYDSTFGAIAGLALNPLRI